jgi:hypothetical protein
MSRRDQLLVLFATGLGVLIVGAAFVFTRDGEPSTSPPAANTFNPHPLAGTFKPDDTKLSSCTDQGCREQAFGNISYREGPKAALRIFDQKIASDPVIEAGCHRIAHMIGSASLARYKGNVSEAFAAGSSSCNSGYYHGILERALVGVGTKAELVDTVQRLCADKDVRATTFLAYQCVHGLGHGLMIHTGLDLPQSLSVCEQLATDWDQTSCDGGVFMENFNSSYGVTSRFLRDNDPIYPCNAVAERHKLYCYLQVTSRLLQKSGYNWKSTAQACARVEQNWRATCFQSYGRDASGVARLDGAELVRLCGITQPAWRGECIYGAVRDIANNDAGAKRAGQFCGLVAVSLRPRCFNGAGSIIAALKSSPADQQASCAAITTRYLSACMLREGSS